MKLINQYLEKLVVYSNEKSANKELFGITIDGGSGQS